MTDEPIPGATSSLPEQIGRWGVSLRLRNIIATELVVAALVLLIPWPSWYVAAAVSALVLLLSVVSYTGATVAGWLRRVARYQWFRRSTSARIHRARIDEAHDAELPGIGRIGVRWDGEHVVTILALHGRPYAPTVLAPDGAKTVDMVPLHLIGDLMRQFGGLELAAVDVVSAGKRASSAQYSATYDEIVADRPAVALRQTFVVLRLRPLACLSAMAYRKSVQEAAAAATERIRQAIVLTGCRALALTADEFDDATVALAGGILSPEGDLGEVVEHWDHVEAPGGYVTCYRIAGKDLNTELVNDIWAIQSTLTVLTVRVEVNGAGEVLLSGLARFHSVAPWPHPPQPELQPVHGQAFDALVSSLPLGDRSMRVQLSRRPALSEDRGERSPGREAIELPMNPAGFMIGTTADFGYPMLMPWTDALRPTRVSIVDGELEMIERLILRASAAGARVLVYSDRPEQWAPVCRDFIELAVPGKEPRFRPTMLVLDTGSAEAIHSNPRAGQTVVTIADAPAAETDVLIHQSGEDVQIDTPDLPGIRLKLMRPRNESQYVAHLQAVTSGGR